MLQNSIGTDAVCPPVISSDIEQVTLNSIRKALPNKIIDAACRKVGYTYRRRKLTPVLTVLHMILAAIWPEESFNASWQVLWDSAVGNFPMLGGKSPSSGSVSKARGRLPLALWRSVFDRIARQAANVSERFAYWRSHRVVSVDGTCVSMPDTPELHAAFGTSNSGYGRGKYPLARIVAVCLANTMTVLSYALGRYSDEENALLKPLLHGLQKGDLLLGDRHFAGANLYVRYLSAGLEFLTRVHQRLKVSRLRRIISYAANDFITDMKIAAKYRRKDPALPGTVRVRMIQSVIRIRGKRKVVWFVTSLLDEQEYPADEIVALYARRWRIETLFRQVKIRLSGDVMRSRTPEGVRKEIAARFVALNIVRTIMLEAAIKHNCDPVELSFVHALRAIIAFAPAMAGAPVWKLPIIYNAILSEIAAHRIHVRPHRNEPRAIRRETKHYPTLRTTREEWRLRNVA